MSQRNLCYANTPDLLPLFDFTTIYSLFAMGQRQQGRDEIRDEIMAAIVSGEIDVEEVRTTNNIFNTSGGLESLVVVVVACHQACSRFSCIHTCMHRSRP